jgi:hypothetical protein
MSRPRYRYFVSFAHGDGYRSGFGNVEWHTSTPINTSDDVCEIQQWLTDQGVIQPTVLYFVLLTGKEQP